MRFALLASLIALTAFARAADPIGDGLSRGITFFERRVKDDPDDFTAANQLADHLLRRFRWTGRLEDLRRAGEVAVLSCKFKPEDMNPGGRAVKASVAMGMHRFAEARDLAEELKPLMPGKPLPPQLRGDALLELGDLDAAERAFREANPNEESTTGTESRASRLAWLRGDFASAQEHADAAVEAAREDLSPEYLVWALVRAGETAFRRGVWEHAEKCYTEALKLAPENWAALDHMAELRGAQSRDAEAVELFTKAATATDRPELWQALGDLHLTLKRKEEAAKAFDRALAGYKDSVGRGELIYIHHLAGFYSDSVPDGAEAVKWARKDLEVRGGGFAHDALAWALYRAGDVKAALEESKKALAAHAVDSHCLYHAGMIHLSSGDIAEGQRLLRQTAEVNPHFSAFHVHR